MKILKLSSLLLVIAAAAAGLSACGGTTSATIGGTVVGLASGNSVTLGNTSNGDSLVYAFNSSSTTFTFSKSVDSNSAYNVTVTDQPTNQTCSVAAGSGTVNSSGSDITNIVVTCTSSSGTTVALQASVVGLANGETLVLTDVSAGSLTIVGTSTSASTTVTQNFPTSLLPGAVYNTTITSVTPPSGQTAQTCTILNSTGAGTVPSSGNPSPVAISCT